jgi:hypothetical protein
MVDSLAGKVLYLISIYALKRRVIAYIKWLKKVRYAQAYRA